MNPDVWRNRQRLEHLFDRASDIDDIELQAHWARYLCVLSSGFLETSVRALFSQYARGAASPDIARFVDERLKSFQSANMTSICSLTRQFNPSWADALEVQTAGDLKDAVDSIVANRHQIAHGDDSGISYVRIKDYYARALKVIDMIRSWCDP